VARYSALIGGIGYGIFHRRTLQKREDARAALQAKKHEEKVQADRKREQDQQLLAAIRGGGSGGGKCWPAARCEGEAMLMYVSCLQSFQIPIHLNSTWRSGSSSSSSTLHHQSKARHTYDHLFILNTTHTHYSMQSTC
jgi:F-type H+-transporting ATP synthase subunit e